MRRRGSGHRRRIGTIRTNFIAAGDVDSIATDGDVLAKIARHRRVGDTSALNVSAIFDTDIVAVREPRLARGKKQYLHFRYEGMDQIFVGERLV